MISIINSLIKVAPRPIARWLGKLKLMVGLFTVSESYLVSTGYIDAFVDKSLKNREGENIPWMNYGIIALLNDKLTKDISLFEFGSGSSTIFFAHRVKEVVSVEYDQEWIHKVQLDIEGLDNVSVHYIGVDDRYPESIGRIKKGFKYDVILIDGRRRVSCAKSAVHHLADDGVVIFDDSQRDKYKEGIEFLENQGFSHLFVEGLAPCGISLERTSIFYKPGHNCLNI